MSDRAGSAAKTVNDGGMEATADDAVRANTYSLLATLLATTPSQEILDLLKQIDVPAEAGTAQMAASWEALRMATERARIDELADEYQDLFIGVGRGELMPYGSWYTTGFLMDRPLTVLREDLAALGFERQQEVYEPEDHVAALCETMGMIIRASEEIPFATQRKFFGDHLGHWMERFFEDLQNAKSARFYRTVGQLGEQFIRFEKRYLGMLA
jgi:TorA maturation chaperone TorD